MSYVVLARKWRPMGFSDLVGQEHVSQTLANAIAANRVAHAFLFTGVRGVGKTTSARILAKALNCLGTPENPASGPTASPCLTCAACKEISEGTDIDVRELDGASNNGVDEVRKLQDSLPYRPNRDRYKIYIIDEVHMLSASAWNAFLKTLEEPPPHVKFIFATTEVHKVPVTILSRVQRFDFKLISAAQIAARLRFVLSQEGVESDDGTVALLAREAAGSMRDAMSLLDQVIAASDGPLRAETSSRVLGVADTKVLLELAQAVMGGNAEASLRVIAQLAEHGYDLPHVAKDILEQWRNLVVAKVCKDPKGLLDVADDEREELSQLAGRFDTEDLLRVHQAFSRSFDDVVRSGQPRAALEMALMRLAQRPRLVPIDDLIGRLSELERRLGGTVPARPGGGGMTGGGPAPRSSGTTSVATASTVATSPTTVSSSATSTSATSASTASVSAASGASTASARSGSPAPPTARTSAPPTASSAAKPVESEPVRSKDEPTGPGAVRTEPARPKEESPALITWGRVLDVLGKEDSQLAIVLAHAVVLQATEEELALSFEQDSAFHERATLPTTLRALEQASFTVFGQQPKVRIAAHQVPQNARTIATVEAEKREQAKLDAIEKVRSHPAVVAATEVLGARVKDVRLPSE